MKKKAKRPTKEIARARALYREYTEIERDEMRVYAMQDRLREKRRLAANRYRMAKQHVDNIMFVRRLGSAKLPTARFLH